MSLRLRGIRIVRRSAFARWLLPGAALLAACAPDAAPPERRGGPAGADSGHVSAEAPGEDEIHLSPEDPGGDATRISPTPHGAGTWTAGIVDIPPEGGISTLVSVRAGGHEEFDRVVWELDGPLPGVHAEYVDEPVRACGSGEPVPLPGDAWLEIRMTPARAHTEDGRATIAERRRATDLPLVLEIAASCDFEAVVTWVIAVRSPEPFRLTWLEDPSRLVVDVRHRR